MYIRRHLKKVNLLKMQKIGKVPYLIKSTLNEYNVLAKVE